jgi:hypothetical protein
MSDSESGQERLFDPTRYSPVTVAIWQRLPESNARAYAIASALGSYRDGSGSSKDIRSGREAAGSLVSLRRLPAVLSAIGISRRQWTRYVAEWEQLYVAHRCALATVFLFTRPEFLECPSCHARLEIDHVPEMWRRKQTSRDARGRFTATTSAVTRPIGGRSTADHSDGMRPSFEPKSDTPVGRSHLGLEVGVSVVEGSGLQEEAGQKALQEIAAASESQTEEP